MANPDQINTLIANRRSVFPPMYNQEPISQAILEQILENANWAPNHRHTEPWRFKVYRGAAKLRLGDYLAQWYKENTPPEAYKEMKFQKTLNKAEQSDTIIAICMQRDPEESVPEWEELAAVSCAVQNMWLTCTAYGIGAYWSSPKSALEANDFLQLGEGERCLGLLYMGNYEAELPTGRRKDWQSKVEWVEE